MDGWFQKYIHILKLKFLGFDIHAMLTLTCKHYREKAKLSFGASPTVLYPSFLSVFFMKKKEKKTSPIVFYPNSPSPNRGQGGSGRQATAAASGHEHVSRAIILCFFWSKSRELLEMDVFFFCFPIPI